MVRLERILYEKAVNTNLLGRARKIASPSTWHKEKILRNNTTVFWPGGILFQGIKNFFLERMVSMEYKSFYEFTKAQGVPMSDFLAMSEAGWRRDILAEQMKRENLHPFVQMVHAHTRCRFWKVDKHMKGFEVPDWVSNESHGQALIDNIDYSNSIKDVLAEYTREMMPRIYMWRSRRVILDILIVHGLINRKNWNRLFYNEAFYTDELLEIEEDRKRIERAKDFTQTGNQAMFKAWMEARIKKFPGVYTREGESFDYDTFFRNHAVVNGHMKPSEEMSQNEIDALRAELMKQSSASLLYSDVQNKILHQTAEDEEVLERKNTVGTQMPQEISPMKYKAWMA
jgi:hypothetical protein